VTTADGVPGVLIMTGRDRAAGSSRRGRSRRA
jgi:hypothetical protein